MGTSTSARQLGRKIDRVSRELRDQKAALGKTGLAGKRIVEAHAAAAGVLGTRARGKRKAISAFYDLTKTGRGVVIGMRGPAHLVANPTKPHFIGPRGFGSLAAQRRLGAGIGAIRAFGGTGRGVFAGAGGDREFHTASGGRMVSRRRRGKRALTIGTDLRGYAFHPGTKGKSFFRQARKVAERQLPGVYGRAQITEPLRKVFG